MNISGATVRHAELLTPVGRGAVATVRAEGQGVVAAVEQWFRPASGKRIADFEVGQIIYGRWGAADESGEELLVCRRDQEQIEIHCHGGVAAAESILAALSGAGFVPCDWRDWARSKATDRIEAEALIALAEARTERAALVLLDQYHGALRGGIERVILACTSDNVEAAGRELAQMLHYERLGRHLALPWRVVLAGAPNVGKSSLANALLGFERSIVFDQPGTTRDVLTSLTAFDGWPVELTDTAGLRESADELESQGVARAQEQLRTADLVLLVFDASQPWSIADEELRNSAPGALIVHNKLDLSTGAPENRPPGAFVSAKTNVGLRELMSAIAAGLVPDAPCAGAAVPFTQSQIDVLRAAQNLLSRKEMFAAAEFLEIAFRITWS